MADAGAKWIFVDGEAQAAKLREVADKLPELQGVIRFTGPAQGPRERTLAELERAGAAWRAVNPAAHAARLASLSLSEPGQLPLHLGHHRQPQGRGPHPRQLGLRGRVRSRPSSMVEPEDLVLLFLPMAHSFAKVIEAVWFRWAPRSPSSSRSRRSWTTPARCGPR